MREAERQLEEATLLKGSSPKGFLSPRNPQERRNKYSAWVYLTPKQTTRRKVPWQSLRGASPAPPPAAPTPGTQQNPATNTFMHGWKWNYYFFKVKLFYPAANLGALPCCTQNRNGFYDFGVKRDLWNTLAGQLFVGQAHETST